MPAHAGGQDWLRRLYWGGASWREHQRLFPNELLQWYAMRYWKDRGMRIYNMVGTMGFKQKFGGKFTAVPMGLKARNPLLTRMVRVVPPIAQMALRLAWGVKSVRRPRRSPGQPV